MPKRIQRKRIKGWRMPDNTVNVCRPGRFGNPFIVGKKVSYDGEIIYVENSEHAVKLFKKMISRLTLLPDMKNILKELRGKDLACWCRPGEPCHGDVWLELANKE